MISFLRPFLFSISSIVPCVGFRVLEPTFHTVRPTSTAKKIGMMGLDVANLEIDEHHS